MILLSTKLPKMEVNDASTLRQPDAMYSILQIGREVSHVKNTQWLFLDD